MARPVGADAEATRGRILRCAAELFAEHGEGNTSMRDIGRAATVSLATVHHYFGSKEELYRSSVDSMYGRLEGLRDDIARCVEPDRALDDIVERATRAAFRYACAQRLAVRLVMRSVMDTGSLSVERRSGLMLPDLEEGASLLSGPTGIDRPRLRGLLRSINHLIVRYAVMEPREMAIVLGGGLSERAALDMMEDHMVHLALTLLGLEEAAHFAHERAASLAEARAGTLGEGDTGLADTRPH